jgi:hypothetical protein
MNKFKKLFVLAGFLFSTLPVFAAAFDDYFKAVALDNESAVIALALRGFDLNTRDEEGNSGLHVGLREGSTKVVAFLLSQRNVKVELQNRAGESPLMLAAIQGRLEAARQLIRRGAQVNKTGWTPLHYAASRLESDGADMVRLMLEHHAYIDAESPNRSTPLMMAAMYGHRSLVPLLLEEGADPSLRNQQGLTAVDFARRADRGELAEMIAQRIREQRPAAR